MTKSRIPVHCGDEIIYYIETEDKEYKTAKQENEERKQKEKLALIKAREESKKRLMKEKAQLSRKYSGYNKGYSVNGKKLGRPKKNSSVVSVQSARSKRPTNKITSKPASKSRNVKKVVRKKRRLRKGIKRVLRIALWFFLLTMVVQGINYSYGLVDGSIVISDTVNTSQVEAANYVGEPNVEELSMEVEEQPVNYACATSSAKTYMDYRAITDKTSTQYNYIREHMTVGYDGYLRDSEGNIGVALGSYFGEIGTKYKVTLSTGKTFNVVKIEAKADNHTINGCYQKWDTSVIEFVVDSSKMEKASNGLVYSGNFNNSEEFNGDIVSMYKIG